MRDPKRIDKFCEILKVYWHMVPDWRFMQLVCNLQAQIGSDGFYLEDDKTIELIEQMDLTVNIDIREIKKRLTELDRRSGYTLRTT